MYIQMHAPTKSKVPSTPQMDAVEGVKVELVDIRSTILRGFNLIYSKELLFDKIFEAIKMEGIQP